VNASIADAASPIRVLRTRWLTGGEGHRADRPPKTVAADQWWHCRSGEALAPNFAWFGMTQRDSRSSAGVMLIFRRNVSNVWALAWTLSFPRTVHGDTLAATEQGPKEVVSAKAEMIRIGPYD
jgi:hypothetical protein